MEFLFIFAAVMTIDVVALELIGATSHPAAHHERALEALKHGELDRYRDELDQLEREISRGAWRIF